MRRTGRNGAAVVLAASLAAEASAIAIVSFLTSDEERKKERTNERWKWDLMLSFQFQERKVIMNYDQKVGKRYLN